ncbi:MAG: hypothetical protein VKQ33_08215 [Candidatus Sericytochromatia bacterium]|nr:hypothetical protein [Candidatus Sericytochromatia bacterium]
MAAATSIIAPARVVLPRLAAGLAVLTLTSACGSSRLPGTPGPRLGQGTNVAVASPRLVGIAFDGRVSEVFDGEVLRPMTLEPVVEGGDPARMRFAWRTEATFVGWDQQRLFHLLPTAPGPCTVTLRAWAASGEELGVRTAVVRVRRAPRPPL